MTQIIRRSRSRKIAPAFRSLQRVPEPRVARVVRAGAAIPGTIVKPIGNGVRVAP